MDLQDLADVHTGWNAQGVQHDVHGGAVLEVRHVLFRKNPGNDALVAVASRHLVAHAQLPLDGHVDLDHLDDARRQFVAAFRAANLSSKTILTSATLSE